MSSCGIMFADAWGLNTHVVPSVTHHYQVHDMTSCIAGRHGHKTLCQPLLVGIYCGGLIAYIVQIRSLFLRTSGSSGVIEGFLA